MKDGLHRDKDTAHIPMNRLSSLRTIATALLLLGAFGASLPACSPTGQGDRSNAAPQVYRGQDRFGLSFEERMAIPPKVSRLRAEARRRADEVYNPFRSREEAMRNETYKQELFDRSLDDFLDETGLTRQQLDSITEEYQVSMGANLR